MGKADRGAERVLADSPSHLLHRALQIALDIYAEETGRSDLTQRQYAVLAAAGALSGASQTDLVRTTGIDRSTLADMVARMIDKGWLARERSQSDARANAVSLTPAGREALTTVQPKVSAADEKILAALPRSRRQGFLAALSLLCGIEASSEAEARPKKKKKSEKALKAGKVKGAKASDKSKRKRKKAKKLQAA